MADTTTPPLMRREQVKVFARGLYHLANTDGIDEREIAVIKEFLDETGTPELMDGVTEGEFDLNEACEILDTSFLRRIFLKAAVVLVRADGEFTDAEQSAVQDVAQAFGLEEALDELFAEVDGVTSFE